MTPSRRRAAWSVAAVLGPAVVALALIPVEPALGVAGVALLLVVPVVLVAWSGSRTAVTVAAASAALAFDFCFTEPRGSFAIHGADDLVLAAILLAVGLVVAQLAISRRRHRSVADRAVSEVAMLRSVAELLADGDATESVVRAGELWLRDVLAVRGCELRVDLEPASPASVSPSGEVVVGDLRWAVERQGLPGPAVDLPVRRDGRTVARFVLAPSPGHPVSPDCLLAAVALADLVGSALEARRMRLSAN